MLAVIGYAVVAEREGQWMVVKSCAAEKGKRIGKVKKVFQIVTYRKCVCVLVYQDEEFILECC